MSPEKLALLMLDKSQCAISGHRVGAVVRAINPVNGDSEYFGGCNIELATSKVWHAEETALIKAIVAGFVKPVECYVTSTNTDQRAAMCGYCMQHFMYANPDCEIVVVNMDGSVKFRTTVRERNGVYAYLGRGKLNTNISHSENNESD